MTRIGGSATEGAEGILEFPGRTRADVRMALWEGGGCFDVFHRYSGEPAILTGLRLQSAASRHADSHASS